MINNKVICFINYNYSPYFLVRLSKTAKMARDYGFNVVAMEIISQDNYFWQSIHKKEIYEGYEKDTLIDLPLKNKWLTIIGVIKMINFLNHKKPQVLAVTGYDNPVTYASLAWGLRNKSINIIMMDSKYDDMPRNFLKERVKKTIFSLYDGALVAGSKSKDYAIALGMSENKIFTGFDVVDNEYFAKKSYLTKEDHYSLKSQYKLPKRYFICVSRLIEKKNLSRLLKAYQIYCERIKEKAWHLIICGWGHLEEELKEEVYHLGIRNVRFVGRITYEEIPVYYSLAKCLILPSSHFEQWGLVVNEAMASGLPVLVSQACGCAPDLVQEGVNGFTFDPCDVESLARFMVKMSSGEVDLKAMGEASRRIIANWTPEIFAENLLKVIDAALAAQQSKKLWWTKNFAS